MNINTDTHKRVQHFPTPEQPRESAAGSSANRKGAAARSEGNGVTAAGSDTPKTAVSRMAEQLVADQAAHYASLCGNVKQACARYLERPAHAAAQVATDFAKKLEGHGGGLSSLVKEFQGEAYRGMGAAEASNKFAERAIKQSPQLAEPIIALKLKGCNQVDRQIATLAMAQSGATGWYKYAACVHALNTIRKYDATERSEVLGLLKTKGTSLDQAVKIEDAELARVRAQAQASRPVTLESLNRTAIANADAQLAACRALNDKVQAADRQVRGIDPAARRSVGLLNAAATVGNVAEGARRSAVAGNPEALEEAIHSADRAATMMMQSEFDNALQRARAGHDQFNGQYLRYCDLNAQYKQAINNQDYRQAATCFSAMSALVPKMKASAESFGASAAVVGKYHKEFDGAAIHAAIHLAVSAVSVGIGGPPGEHLVSELLGHGAGAVYGAAVESAATHGASAALERH